MSVNKITDTITPALMEDQQITPKCCCCIPLKIACFTLGYLTLFINSFSTLILIGATIVTGMLTNGFTYARRTWVTDGNGSDLNHVQVDLSIFAGVLLIIGIILLINIVWLVWNVCVLVGLHKKRPGPITLHTVIACIRLAFLIICLVTGTGPSSDFILMGIEIGITGCFIITYHSYATQMAREQKSKILTIETTPVPEISITDTHFAYPKILDKQHLVEKERY